MPATLKQIHTLEERYPFQERELETLIRAHDQIRDEQNKEEGFLVLLSLASPYTEYFLPGNEIKNRVTWIEDHVLPSGFPNMLRAAISADPFVDYANEGENKSLERFLEGIADTGRRGPRQALRILYELVGDPSANELIDLCFRLTLACDALIEPNLDKMEFLERLKCSESTIDPTVRSLAASSDNQLVEKGSFITWAEQQMPLLSSPLSTFIHHLLFHRSAYPAARVPYKCPDVADASDIFNGVESPILFALPLISSICSEKWSRLYSSVNDGRSFNLLEKFLLGYDGPTVLIVRTTEDAVVGAYTYHPWKDSTRFYGSADCFMFGLSPELKVCWPTGRANNFMFMNSAKTRSPIEAQKSLPRGIGLGGNVSMPRFFIPESFESCSVAFIDKTFDPGEILPDTALDKFEIAVLEVWGVGSDQTIAHAIQKRQDQRTNEGEDVRGAGQPCDKEQLFRDLRSGLIPSKLFEHNEEARGRHEFRVDDEHGGYKIE